MWYLKDSWNSVAGSNEWVLSLDNDFALAAAADTFLFCFGLRSPNNLRIDDIMEENDARPRQSGQ